MIYDRPIYYALIHITIGMVAAWFPPLFPLFLIYQLVQLLLNKRFFLFEGEIRNGNSVPHTALKIAEVCVGFLIGRWILDSPTKKVGMM